PSSDLEPVAPVGLALAAIAQILGRPRRERSERALLAVVPGLPVEPVVLAGRARHLLGVLEHLVAVAVLARVSLLGIGVDAGDLDRRQLVAADAPVDDLLEPVGGVEAP